MKSLCVKGSVQAETLEWLTRLVESDELSGTEAWSLFSAPTKTSYSKAEGNTYEIKDKEKQNAVKELKDKVKANLYEHFSGACAYCRRPVAHYHYGWQIEHVEAKSWHPNKTFLLSNLALACIECNSWKGHVDKRIKEKPLPIVNPRQKGFIYSKHLHFISVTMDRVSMASYEQLSPEGIETYKELKFHEIERAVILDSVDVNRASLHARMDRLIAHALAVPEAKELAELLSALKSTLYTDTLP